MRNFLSGVGWVIFALLLVVGLSACGSSGGSVDMATDITPSEGPITTPIVDMAVPADAGVD